MLPANVISGAESFRSFGECGGVHVLVLASADGFTGLVHCAPTADTKCFLLFSLGVHGLHGTVSVTTEN